jgi:hypothetical protein
MLTHTQAGLARNARLEMLALGDAALGDAGARMLAPALACGGLRALRMLDLSAKGLGACGARALAHALARHGTLETLVLRWACVCM